MSFVESFKESIFDINQSNFEEQALAVFRYQYIENGLYRSYCNYLKKSPTNVKDITQIPFLPISCFREHLVKSGTWTPVRTFLSSGTTGSGKSKHQLRDPDFYRSVSRFIFESVYGELSAYTLLGLLPSYQEQADSSLIFMVDHFITQAAGGSGYFLHKGKKLIDYLENGDNTLLFGVSFALLEAVAHDSIKSKNTIIIETGGMKGRRKELTRDELHSHLRSGFDIAIIHSEYGMTELLSQFYATREGKFGGPPWTKVLIRDINDPFCIVPDGTIGGLNIIDLANIDTCAFIETKDLGKIVEDELFQVLGRFDNTDIRGCSLMI